MNWFLHWVITSACLLATAYLVPGFNVTNMFSAFLGSAALGLLNIILWPILAILTLPLTIVTFGLFLFVVNAMVLKFGAALVPGFYIEGFMPAIIGGFVLTVIGWAANKLLKKEPAKD